MRLRTLLIGALALVFGGSAAVGAYLLAQPSTQSSEVETVAIVVAAVDAPRGVTLSTEMLVMQTWPEDYLPKNALRSIEEAEGRAVWVPIVEGEPVTDAKLTDRGAGRGMAAMIPRGMRAVTLHTPNVSTAMAGFILPGNKVDVLLTVSQSGFDSTNGGSSSVTLLQNVEVLAVDQRIDASSESVVNSEQMQSVTLLVTPEQAARLDLGQNRGMLRLALRNPEDGEISDVEPALLSALQLGPTPPATAAPVVTQPAADDATPDGVRRLAADASGSKPNALLPVRTLRGTQSSVLYLRRPAVRQQANTGHGEPIPAQASL